MTLFTQEICDSTRSFTEGTPIHKRHCIFGFDTASSEDGLYICLKNFRAVGKQFVPLYFQKTSSNVFLHWKQTKTLKIEGDEPQSKKPNRLAIGLEGGFKSDSIEYDDQYEIVIFTERGGFGPRFKLNDSQVPTKIVETANAVIKASNVVSANAAWDGDFRAVSKHADTLTQLPTQGRVIPGSGWKCEQCDLTSNLWLNLSDGSILCGRKNWDGTGGNNHAVDHYKEVKHPLAVKLGTITGKGGDVFSYDEDDMVMDPNLEAHLKHWGIRMSALTKTEQTMSELEIDLNTRTWEYMSIQESSKSLEKLYGPGLTGLNNLGNTCYIASVIQALFSCKNSFRDAFPLQDSTSLSKVMTRVSLSDLDNSIEIQLLKLVTSMLSGEYSKPVENGNGDDLHNGDVIKNHGIDPYFFKVAIGKSHSEFQTSQQQDAVEFLNFLLERLETFHAKNKDKQNAPLTFPVDPLTAIRFRKTNRQCYRVGDQLYYKFLRNQEFVWMLPINGVPDNMSELSGYDVENPPQQPLPEGAVRPTWRLETLLERGMSPCSLDPLSVPADVASSGKADETTVTSYPSTLPNLLILQVGRFGIKSDWTPYKKDVLVEAPQEIDLSHLVKSVTDLPGPDAKALPDPDIPAQLVSQIEAFGMSREAAIKGIYHTTNFKRTLAIDAAVNFIMEQTERDASFATTAPTFSYNLVEAPSSGSTNGTGDIDESVVDQMTCMGLEPAQCKLALKRVGGNLEAAIEYVFANQDSLAIEVAMEQSNGTNQPSTAVAKPDTTEPEYLDAGVDAAKYRMVAFISHMGSNTSCGHYVAHVRTPDKGWVLFNDEKVLKSETPPFQFGYVYFYQRITPATR